MPRKKKIFSAGADPVRVLNRWLPLLAIVLIVSFRVCACLNETRGYFLQDRYRVGLIPWSDAAGWYGGARDIARGDSLTGLAARRPLYPLFLSTLITLTSSDYFTIALAQSLIEALAVTTAFLLLKKLKHPELGLFLGFLLVWRVRDTPSMMTEGLSLSLLIVAFALLIRGFIEEKDSLLFPGFFLTGLAQAVRPWCLLTMVSLPLALLVHKNPSRKALKRALACLALVAIGFGFHFAASWIFSATDSGGNYCFTVYGQVSGGKSWRAAYDDPAISRAMEQGMSGKKLNSIVYGRSLEIFLEKPLLLLRGIFTGYIAYIKNLATVFARVNWWIFLVAGALFSLIQSRSPPRVSRKQLVRCTCVGGGCLLASVSPPVAGYGGLLLCLAGAVSAWRPPVRPLDRLFLFYVIGIILTIPLVGGDGGPRVMIGNDILLFYLAAKTIALLAGADTESRTIETDESKTDSPAFDPKLLVSIVAASVIVFLLIPFELRRHGFSQKQDRGPNPVDLLTADAVAGTLELPDIPLDPEQLGILDREWPESSCEKHDGSWAFLAVEYSAQDALSLKAGQGAQFYIQKRAGQHWPLSPMDVDRTVLVIPNKYTMLRNTTKEELIEFAERKIAVAGTLIARKKPFRNATAFVLDARYIGLPNGENKLTWFSITSLNKPRL